MKAHCQMDRSGFEREYNDKQWLRRDAKSDRDRGHDRHWFKAERKQARKEKRYLAEVVREEIPARVGIMVNGRMEGC